MWAREERVINKSYNRTGARGVKYIIIILLHRDLLGNSKRDAYNVML